MTMHIHGRQIGWAVALATWVALVMGGGEAYALTLDGSGNVTDWGVSPFSGSGTPTDVHNAWAPQLGPGDPVTYWKEENNYSPVSYPGIGNVPSPGNGAAEKFDFEALYYRVKGSDLQVLVVGSPGHDTAGPGVSYFSGGQHWYRMGDLFLKTDAGTSSTWDFAVATTDYNDGRDAGHADRKIRWWAYDADSNSYALFDHSDAPGTLYGISYAGFPSDPDGSLGPGGTYDVVTVVDRNAAGGGWALVDGDGNVSGQTGTFDHRGYGADVAREPELRPWVVNPDGLGVTDHGGITLTTASWDYGSRPGGGYLLGGSDKTRNEDDTWFYEYSMPLDMLGLDGTYDIGNLGIHITTECGNDKLTSDGMTVPPPPPPPIPEPATMAGLVLGVGSLVGYLRRRR